MTTLHSALVTRFQADGPAADELLDLAPYALVRIAAHDAVIEVRGLRTFTWDDKTGLAFEVRT
jgi:hypothetical protein